MDGARICHAAVVERSGPQDLAPSIRGGRGQVLGGGEGGPGGHYCFRTAWKAAHARYDTEHLGAVPQRYSGRQFGAHASSGSVRVFGLGGKYCDKKFV